MSSVVKLISEILQILTQRQRRSLLVMQSFLLGSSIVELVGITSIAPYLAVVADPGLIHSNKILSTGYNWSGRPAEDTYLIYLGILVLLLVVISGVFSMINTWVVTKYSQFTGQEFAIRLYQYYLTRPWLFHTDNNSSELMSKISQETNRVTFHIIWPLMRINARMMSVILILVGLTALDPFLAGVATVILVGSYVLIFNLVKSVLSKNGQVITLVNAKRFRAMNEGFGGIKELKLLDKEYFYSNLFEDASLRLAGVTTVNLVIAAVPRFLLEILAFGGILSVTLWLLFRSGDFNTVVPVLSIYAIAGFKLLPAFQQIYGSMADIRGGKSAFDSVKDELLDAAAKNTVNQSESQALKYNGNIELRAVSFRYPAAKSKVFDNLSVTINRNTTVGIAGPSGSGKTTLADIILGLITPDHGQLVVDGIVIENELVKSWQKCVGYVPQSIFLADTSIALNIAFGLDKSTIDHDKLNRAIEMAKLDDYVSSLPNGVNTIVGERGAQLSGGQKQRVGIARALYHDASVLVLDEATSALDGRMESEVMSAISSLHHQKTVIIIAHRLTTLKLCDEILCFENGRLVEQGTYDYLNTNSDLFRNMANIS